MSFAELLLVVIVAILVFSPGKLPLLAEDIAKVWAFFFELKEQAQETFAVQKKQLMLKANQLRAQEADKNYHEPP